ncbi:MULTISPECIES: transglycosylase domain-containing protein [unclassified Microbacterium]|uniref:transglycosylase domain-containing protein n=1 Tax=unclassified Microbacterium TaxID=2609290 RepID=UPI0007892564|nr:MULTISPECIES: transglycosylase domain-containing protein [unclassified Microbacterium]KYJ97522.1 thioredoxin [Microbacterium sp. CH1]
MPQKNRTVKGVLGGLVGLVGLSAIAGLLVTASVTPVLAMTGVAGTTALTIFDELPEVLKVDTPMEQSTIYATNPEGQPVVLASFYEQNRVPVKYEEVSPILYDAILSSEDKNFYTHGGVNLGATVKALVDNVRGTSSRGASTISQQFVKNVRIQQCEQDVDTASDTYSDELQQCWQDATNASGVDGIERKLQEMRYAIQIEKDYSKNDILLGYLNIANFGGTVYGIEAAARYYFSTTAANLTVAQAATLAGIVQNPNTYRIDKPEGTYTQDGVSHNSAADGYKDAKDRRDYVLGRMLDDKKITQAQHDEAMASAIEPAITVPVQGCAAAGRNAYFCQYVKSIVENDEAFGADIQERRDLLRRGGLKIYTSLDFRVQDPAAEAMADIVPANFDNKYFGAAGVSIEVGTGRILSITQNTMFSETPTTDQAYSSLVFAGDQKYGKSGGFQVGSTYKLFTLIDWLEKGHSVRENLNGTVQTNLKIPVCGSPQVTNTAEIGNFGRSRGYPGTPMTFTAQSLNSGYFAMASKLDVCDINEVADKMGVTLASGEKVTEENVPYDVLGPKNISPIAMANAYATVASGGTYCTPRAIDKVIDAEGKERELPKASCTEGVLAEEVAATAAYALQGVMTSGGTGAVANPFDGTPLIGKTGTHDLWSTMMIESSTKVATAVWAGRSNGNHDNVFNVWTGNHRLNEVRYPLAKAAQRAANQAYGGDDFPRPDNNLIRQVQVSVPSVIGQTIEEATATLERAGFTASVGQPVDSDKPTNIIAAQDPSGQAAAGSTITISPSNGNGVTVPDVTGQSPTAANAALIAAGFTTVERAGSCNAEGATVTATDPAANSAATKSTPVRVTCN